MVLEETIASVNTPVTEISAFDEVATGVVDIASLKDISHIFLCSFCNKVFPDSEREAHLQAFHGDQLNDKNVSLEITKGAPKDITVNLKKPNLT